MSYWHPNVELAQPKNDHTQLLNKYRVQQAGRRITREVVGGIAGTRKAEVCWA